MREIRQSGSEGGGHESNPVSLPLLHCVKYIDALYQGDSPNAGEAGRGSNSPPGKGESREARAR